MHRQFPYDLNMQRPLPDLMQDIPDQLRKWEMTTGHRHRAEFLWSPLRAYLEGNRKIIAKL